MRCTIGTLLLCVAATSAAPQAQDIFGGSRDLNRRGEGVNHLERWVDFVQAHRAGVPDSGTHQLESWTAADLESDLTTRGLSADDFVVAVVGGRAVGCAALSRCRFRNAR